VVRVSIDGRRKKNRWAHNAQLLTSVAPSLLVGGCYISRYVCVLPL
jgi:hypothetical protein